LTSPAAEETGALVELVRGPITPDIEQRLNAAMAQRPRDIRLKFAQGDLLAKTGRADQALAMLRGLTETHPTNPWVALRIVRLLLDQAEVEAAAATFVAGVWNSALPEGEIVGALSDIASALRGYAARRSFLASLLAGGASDRFVLVKLGSLAFREGDRAEATRLFDAAAALGPLPAEAGPLHLELLMVSGRANDALAAALDILRTRPDRLDVARRAILAARLARRTDVLVPLLQDTLERWPTDWLLVFRYNRALCPFDLDRALFLKLATHADVLAADDRWMFQFALACLRHEDTGRALAILRRLKPESPVAHMSEPLLAAMSSRPDEAWCNPRGVSNDPAEDVQLRRVPDARATLIVLAGVQGGLGYLPYSHADVLLGSLPANVIYLKDRRELAFTGGVASLGPDEAATVAALKHMLVQLGGVPAIALGASLGGASAVRLGSLIGAKAALSFAGPLQWSAAGTGDDDSEVSRSRLRNAMYSAFTNVETSLVDMIAASPATEVHHFYGEGHQIDAQVVETLRDLPNFHRHGVSGCDHHYVMSHLIATGAFDLFLRQLVEG
jgi:tetratricopeptide (TPR) repeat protein